MSGIRPADAELRRHGTKSELAHAVAVEFLRLLGELQGRGVEPHVVLTGGGIADAVHREVAALAASSPVDFARVVFWFGDERFVEPTSPERNAVQAREAFLDAVGATRVHEVAAFGDTSDVEGAALQYGSRLADEAPERFDLVMLGLGEDGHVASLFPGFEQLEVHDRPTVAVHDSPKPPPLRVSLTFAALNANDRVWLLVSGEGKADAVARARGTADHPEPAPVDEIPVGGVRGGSELVWWLDDGAARRL